MVIVTLFSHDSPTLIQKQKIFKTFFMGVLFYGSCLSIEQAQGMVSRYKVHSAKYPQGGSAGSRKVGHANKTSSEQPSLEEGGLRASSSRDSWGESVGGLRTGNGEAFERALNLKLPYDSQGGHVTGPNHRDAESLIFGYSTQLNNPVPVPRAGPRGVRNSAPFAPEISHQPIDLSSSASHLQDKEKDVEELKNQLEHAQSALSGATESSAKTQLEAEVRLRLENDEIKAELAHILEETNALKENTAERTREISELQDSLRESAQALKDQQALYDFMRTTGEEKEKVTSKLEEAQAVLQSTLEAKEREIQDRQNELEAKQDELNTSKSTLERIESELGKSNLRCSELEESLRVGRESAENELKSLRSENESLREARSEEDYSILQREFSEYRASAEENARELDEYRTNTGKDKKKIISENGALRNEIKTLKESAEQTNNQLTSLFSQLSEAKKAEALAEQYAEEVARRLSESEEVAERLTSDLTASRAREQTLEEAAKKSDSALEESQARIQALENELMLSRTQQNVLQESEDRVRTLIIDSLSSLNRTGTDEHNQYTEDLISSDSPTAELATQLGRLASLADADIRQLEDENDRLRSQIEESNVAEANEEDIQNMF